MDKQKNKNKNAALFANSVKHHIRVAYVHTVLGEALSIVSFHNFATDTEKQQPQQESRSSTKFIS